MKSHRICKLLVANHSEIAIRISRAVAEPGIRTVVVYAHDGRFALHRSKASGAYEVCSDREPIQAHLDGTP